MEIKSILNNIKLLDSSPLRKHFRSNNMVSLFEEERISLKDIDETIKISMENLHQPLKVVVLGEVKAGKSTLVNALVGKKVSYTNVVEATSAIIEIKYSAEEKILIHLKNQEVMNLSSLAELDELIDVNRDKQDFFDRISKISILTNTERLKEITIVDTPGLKTITSENSERTDNYIVNADVILWVLNSHHLGQTDITNKIEEVMDYGKSIICVLNRIDEINGDIDEVVGYVQSEMGYMFSQIFAVSAKMAWDGYAEKNQIVVKESRLDDLYNYIVKNIERNSEQFQRDSISESINVQIARDLYVHKNAKHRIDGILEKMNLDVKELRQFNITLKQIVSNKISEWIDTKLFEDERQLLMNCGNDKELANLAKKYSSNEYMHSLINCKYDELNNYILNEWTNNTEQLLKMENQSELAVTTIINPSSIIETQASGTDNVVEGVKQGGLTAGAIGLGLAGYAAWLGPAAASVSIGSAVSAFFPPLLIAGAIGGAVWKLIGSDKKKVSRYTQINALVLEIKSIVKNKAAGDMKDNLNQASDYYFDNSVSMITSILSQCNITKEELESMDHEIGRYIRVGGCASEDSEI